MQVVAPDEDVMANYPLHPLPYPQSIIAAIPYWYYYKITYAHGNQLSNSNNFYLKFSIVIHSSYHSPFII